MRGVQVQYPLDLSVKLPRWFISYEDKYHRYVEENFDTKAAAVARIRQLSGHNIEAELWTRERAIPGQRLKPKQRG